MNANEVYRSFERVRNRVAGSRDWLSGDDAVRVIWGFRNVRTEVAIRVERPAAITSTPVMRALRDDLTK